INDVCAISEPEHSDRSLDGPPHHGALHSSPTRRSSDLGISIPQGAQSITIGADGTVSVQIAGQSAPTQVGTLQLTDFVNPAGLRSEEHTSELQSRENLVCRRLLEKKKPPATRIVRAYVG